MNEILSLIEDIKQMELYQRTLELRCIIEENPKYQMVLTNIKNLQKRLMNKTVFHGSLHTKTETQEYEMKLDLLLSDPIVEEYLENIQVLNNLFQKIQTLFQDQLSFEQ